MKFRTLIRRSLRYHWRAHLGVVLGAAIGSAALIGALVVGDSVKESLREQVLLRLAWTSSALDSGDRLASENLANKLKHSIRVQSTAASATNRESGSTIVPMYHVNAVVVNQNSGIRASKVNLYVGTPPFISHSVNAGNGDGSGRVWTGFDDAGAHDPDRLSRAQEYVNEIRAEAVTNSAKAAWIYRYGLPATEDKNEDSACLNEALATQLQAKVGDTIILRLRKPSALAGDAVISPRNEPTVSIRQRVGAIVSAQDTGNFALRASQVAPFNVFISRHTFTNMTGKLFRPNIMAVSWNYQDWPSWYPRWLRNYAYVGRLKFIYEPRSHSVDVAELNRVLRDDWTLHDIQAELRPNSQGNLLELRSERVFLDSPLVRSAELVVSDSAPLLTLLANLISAGTNGTPYSMVTAAGAPWTPADLRDDEIVVSQWLADDLHVKPGDEIALSYFLPESGAKLTEATNTFRVRSIVPPEMPWADRTLMPDFPGIEKAESTSDWDAGFPLTYKVRPKDEDYWKKFRGTPKAFITLAAGQKMWGNRFGNLTAIRLPIPSGSSGRESAPSAGNENQSRLTSAATVETYRAALEKKILANLKPEELGLRFEPVREQALKAAEESQDFGGLFLGFSFFVIAAAVLLMALLFSLGLEQRAPEIGTFLALGFTPRQVRKLLLREAVVLSLVGGIIGAFGGLAYAKAMLQGLTTVWRDAVGGTTLNFHYTGQTLLIGIFASAIVSVLTIWLALRKFVKRPARELLVGEIGEAESGKRSRGKLIGVASVICAAGALVWAFWSGETTNAESFFSAGSLVLIAGLAFTSAWLASRAGIAPVSDLTALPQDGNRRDACPTLGSLALRGCARRRKRSLATIAMLASGSFLIVSIGVFRLDANRDATQKTSGTGGFALIGETTMPVVHDLNSQPGRDFFALNPSDLSGVSFVPFRVHQGDEASCLNLNAAQQPRLLGVQPELLEKRFGFAKGEGWNSLRRAVGQASRLSPSQKNEEKSGTGATPVPPDEIPAIGDANSIQWAMHKKVGDTIDYVDERGQPFKVRIVGAVAKSILQGQLIIDEAEFVKRFPNESGYRMFLIDAPSNAVSQVSATLSRAMQDVGLELTPAVQRLNEFNAVQNTYLGTFQVLGGLGLLLGSVGLGIVVLRNVLERRGELALLLAVGFCKPQVQRLLLLENGALLAAGLALGVVAAAVAVLPALLTPGSQLPYASLALTLTAVLVNGALWTWAATLFAVRGDLLRALRNE